MSESVTYAESFDREYGLTRDNATEVQGWAFWKKDDTTGKVVTSTLAEIKTAVAAVIAIGDDAPTVTGAVCVDLSVTAREKIDIYDVVARFEIPEVEQAEIPDSFDDFMAQSQSTETTDNPFGPKHSFTTAVIEEFWPEDMDGKPFVNSAGEPLQPLIPFMTPLFIRRSTVNRRTEPAEDLVGTADGNRLLSGISGEEKFHKNKSSGVITRYFEVTFEVTTHPFRNWDPVIVYDAGYKQKVVKNGVTTLEEIKSEVDGQPKSSQSLLDGAGHALAPGGKPFPLKFKVKRKGKIPGFFD